MNDIEKKAIAFLRNKYEYVRDYVSSSPCFLDYANEKMHHSMQVIGAMKYIMKNEKTFQNRDEYFLNRAKIATILHDVGRFEEIRLKFEDKKEDGLKMLLCSKYNHGYLGYEILKNSSEYNDPRIYIPVKHHGGLTEALYSDEEFQSITDEKVKKEIEDIIKLVRDADKSANFYLFTSAGVKHFPNLFPRSKGQEDKVWDLSENTRNIIKSRRLMKSSEIQNYLDEAVHLLIWIYDINFMPSYDLIIKNGSLERSLKDVLHFCAKQEDKDFIVSETKSFIKQIYAQK